MTKEMGEYYDYEDWELADTQAMLDRMLDE